MKIQFTHKYEDIIGLDNLLSAWQEFLSGKRSRRDVQLFETRLMDNIFSLHDDLLYHRYCHGSYHAFKVTDPKPRNIHKASVRDRLLHHTVYRLLYPFFNRTYISDSYSCRLGKGTHRALNQFSTYSLRVSRNNTKTCWVLKGDVRKFFASIDHTILINIIKEYISDKRIIWLLDRIINSFDSGIENKGLPLGNLTSQLFANVYLNKFDQYIKHTIKAKYYIRYADDFVILSDDEFWLKSQVSLIKNFLSNTLRLEIHPKKLFIKTIASGVDFLGWVHFSDHRVLRSATKRRMLKKLGIAPRTECVTSYLGMLKHGNAKKMQVLLNKYLLDNK